MRAIDEFLQIGRTIHLLRPQQVLADNNKQLESLQILSRNYLPIGGFHLARLRIMRILRAPPSGCSAVW